MSSPVTRNGWDAFGDLLRTRRWHLNVFWNTAGRCFTVQVLDEWDRFVPPEDENVAILAAGLPRLADALRATARMAQTYADRPR